MECLNIMATATYKRYKLHFTSPLHIADRHEDENVSLKTIQSDTIYAALMSCLAKTGVAIPENGDLGFSVSSLFPYYQRNSKEEIVYFLPMPMQARLSEIKDVSMAKKMKGIQWVDSKLYDSILFGENFLDKGEDIYPYIQESYLTSILLHEDADGSKEFVKSELSQRVTLNSRTGEENARPYYVDKVIFKYDSGLYFLATGDTDLLEKALSMLSKEGIGTDRNVGFGFFDYSVDTMTIDIPDNTDYQISLSMLIPESNKQLSDLLASENVAYDFARRGGWITSPPFNTIRKNAIYAFIPGSVFCLNPNQSSSIIGKIVNLKPEIGELTPDHPIWRNGKAIMLPIKLK